MRKIPAVGEGKRGEEGHLGYLLRQAGAAYRLKLERALADLSVTAPQFAVLTMLFNYPGSSNADVARLSMLTPQTVSVIIGNLEKMRAIERSPHPVHGRIQTIQVSDTGRKLLVQCRTRVVSIDHAMTDGMSAGEEKTIRRWLVRVAIGGAPAR